MIPMECSLIKENLRVKISQIATIITMKSAKCLSKNHHACGSYQYLILTLPYICSIYVLSIPDKITFDSLITLDNIYAYACIQDEITLISLVQ